MAMACSTSTMSSCMPRSLISWSRWYSSHRNSGTGNFDSFCWIAISVSTSRLLYAMKVDHFTGSCSGRLRVLPPLALVGFAGDEIADERLALHLLVFQLEDFADTLQRGAAPCTRPIPGAAPGGWVKVIPDGVLLYAVGRKILRIVPAQPDGKGRPAQRTHCMPT